MLRPIVWIFLIASAVFAAAHFFAVQASLYWYYWWFDSVMHTIGGILITVGLFAFGTFSRIQKQPKFWQVALVLIVVVTTWEVFEWHAGLFDPATHLFDTAKDMILGFVAGSLTYFGFIKLKK